MGISKRLKTIADLVTPGLTVADIGTDHGFVPVYLVRNNISPFVFAADVSKGSLEKARENVTYFHLEDRIECRLSDGFSAFSPGEAECAVISGMGGILIAKILSASPLVTDFLKEVILSPHRDAELVRECVFEAGFKIITDMEIEDKKKKYVIIKAVREPKNIEIH